MRVTYFSAGSVGAGHVVRAMAIREALARQDAALSFTALLPHSPYLRHLGEDGQGVVVDAAELSTPAGGAGSALARAIAASAPDLLLVDLFWAPLVHVPFPCPAWLLLSSVPPAWLVGPPGLPFATTPYARVLAIEPAPLLARFDQIAPVVMRPPEATRDEARVGLAKLLGVDDSGPLQVIVSAGTASDGDVLEARAQAQGGRWLRLSGLVDDATFPVSHLLMGADAIIAAPGYNTFWESRLFGFDDRCTWVPIKRILDDVYWRASLSPDIRFDVNGADVLADLIARG